MKKIFTALHPVKIGMLISIISVSSACLWAQATPNAGFENWTHNSFPSYDTPNNWDNANPQSAIAGVFGCIKATAAADIHSGSAAVKLITKSILSNIAPGVVTTGTLPTSTSGSITGGIPYTLRPDSIVGWYKYTPQGGDNGFAEFYLFGSTPNNADTVATARFVTPATTVGTYTRFAAALVYRSGNAVANSIWLLSSSNNSATAVVGSTVFFDDLALIINPVAVTEQDMPELTIYPNPAVNYIIINNKLNSKTIFVLYDVTGSKVAEKITENPTNFISVNSFPAGLYLYFIKDKNYKAVKSGKLIIQK